MGTYFAVLFIISFFAILIELSKYNQNSKNKIFTIIAGIILFCIYFIKDNSVGMDYPNYLNYFFNRQIPDINYLFNVEDYDSFERGYALLTFLMSKISQTDIFFTFVMGLLMSILPLITLYKYANPLWAGIFLFIALNFYTNSFSLLRQSIAIYICWFSIPYILNHSIKKFLLVIFIASLFHKTALIFIPLYYIYMFKFNNKYILNASILFVILYILLIPIMQFITITLDLNDYIDEDVSGGYTLLAFIIVIFIASRIFIKDDSEEKHLFLHMLFINMGLQFLSTNFNILTRITYYYQLSLIILVPLIVNHKTWGKYRLLIICLFFLLFCIYFYKTNITNLQNIIPYETRYW